MTVQPCERDRFKSYSDLSSKEKDRLKEILEELRAIFNAESVGFVEPEYTAGPKTNYTIRIYGGDSIGYVYD